MIIRDKFINKFSKVITALRLAVDRKQDVKAKIDDEWYMVPYTGDDTDMNGIILDHYQFVKVAKQAQVVLFSAEQADVFSAISESYQDDIDFRLPFDNVFLQFLRPIKFYYEKRSTNDYDRGSLLAVAVRQTKHNRSEVKEWIEKDTEEGKLSIDLPDDGDDIFINQLCFLYEDWGTENLKWASGANLKFSFSDDTRSNAMLHWKNLVIACIQYINCENIYLEKVGEVSESLNRKREKKGKSRLEPYYICRIRGINYDSDPTGEGSKHGIRYDVRGHFRRYDSGKTVWVRPHQRGLSNELYIPKQYKVDIKR
jgi:hypothetical protein